MMPMSWVKTVQGIAPCEVMDSLKIGRYLIVITQLKVKAKFSLMAKFGGKDKVNLE